MTAVKFYQGKKVYLRPVEQEDHELVYAGKNDAHVRETLFLSAPMTLEQVRAEMNAWTGSKETVLFTICRQDDQQPVGQTALVRIDLVSRAAVFFIAIYNPAFWSQGFAGEATRLMVDYAFNVLNLNRIQLHVCCDNDHAVKAYQHAGFKVEGTLRQAMYHHNRYCDFFVMSILREEYYQALNV